MIHESTQKFMLPLLKTHTFTHTVQPPVRRKLWPPKDGEDSVDRPAEPCYVVLYTTSKHVMVFRVSQRNLKQKELWIMGVAVLQLQLTRWRPKHTGGKTGELKASFMRWMIQIATKVASSNEKGLQQSAEQSQSTNRMKTHGTTKKKQTTGRH